MSKSHVILKHYNARMPYKPTSSTDAGYDVFAIENFILKPREIKKIDTHIIVTVPEGMYIQLVPRSGLSSKGILIANSPGTIDYGYTGHLIVTLYNATDEPYIHDMEKGIAQIIYKNIDTVTLVEATMESAKDELERREMARGAKGFGSSDKN